MPNREDANAIFTLAVMSFGAVISLAALVMDLASAKNVSGHDCALHYMLTAATVLGSCLLVSVMYSFHDANLYCPGLWCAMFLHAVYRDPIRAD